MNSNQNVFRAGGRSWGNSLKQTQELEAKLSQIADFTDDVLTFIQAKAKVSLAEAQDILEANIAAYNQCTLSQLNAEDTADIICVVALNIPMP